MSFLNNETSTGFHPYQKLPTQVDRICNAKNCTGFAEKFEEFSEYIGQDPKQMLTLACDSMLQEDHWKLFSKEVKIKELSSWLNFNICDRVALNSLGDLLLFYKMADLAYFFYCKALRENEKQEYDADCEHDSLLQLSKILYCRSLGLRHGQLADSLNLARDVFDYLFTHHKCEEAETYAFDMST